MAEGKQFAETIYGTEPLSVSRDKFNNEIASDKPMHTNSTPNEGAWNWGGNQYDDSPGKGGFSGYGTEVSPPSEVQRSSVDVSKADRGQES